MVVVPSILILVFLFLFSAIYFLWGARVLPAGTTAPVPGPSDPQLGQALMLPVENLIRGQKEKIYDTDRKFTYYQTTGLAQRTTPPHTGHLEPAPELWDVFVHRVGSNSVQSWMYSEGGVWVTLAGDTTHPTMPHLLFFAGRTERLWPRWVAKSTYNRLIAEHGDA
ncbi:hypothetical protein BC834DRAFT_418106 [Gloeopeniophorella convolvens]|nr:hypothetical protein BC834DRAFT_418106 [Gloeopeniophorella convolvens]